MTVAEIAAEMRPRYEMAVSRDVAIRILQLWNEMLESAEPNEAQPDELEAAIAAAVASWERHTRRRNR